MPFVWDAGWVWVHSAPHPSSQSYQRKAGLPETTVYAHKRIFVLTLVCVFIYHRPATLFKPYLSPVTKKKQRMKKSSLWQHHNRVPQTPKSYDLLPREVVVSACVVESKTRCKGVNWRSETRRRVFQNPSRQRHKKRSAERKGLPVTTHQRFAEGPGNDTGEKLLARSFRV